MNRTFFNTNEVEWPGNYFQHERVESVGRQRWKIKQAGKWILEFVTLW
jgi:hypothetical protein